MGAKRVDNTMRDTIINLARIGKAVPEICQITGYSRSCVYKTLSVASVKPVQRAESNQLTLTAPKGRKVEKCQSCGANLIPGFKYCPYCGAEATVGVEQLIAEMRAILYGCRDEITADAADLLDDHLTKIARLVEA